MDPTKDEYEAESIKVCHKVDNKQIFQVQLAAAVFFRVARV